MLAENIFDALGAAKVRSKRKVPVRPAKEVPALANVRALVSAAQLNISWGKRVQQRGRQIASRNE
jgi:hypothetical protein